MQAIIVVGEASDIMDISPSDVAGYLDYGGSVYGNTTFAPSPNEYFSDATDMCGVYATREDDKLSSSDSTSNYKSTSEYSRSTSEDEPEADASAPIHPSSTSDSIPPSSGTSRSDQGLKTHEKQAPSATSEKVLSVNDADDHSAADNAPETNGYEYLAEDYPATTSAPAAGAIPQVGNEYHLDHEEAVAHNGHPNRADHPDFQGHPGFTDPLFDGGRQVDHDRWADESSDKEWDQGGDGENQVDEEEHWRAEGVRFERPKRPWESGTHY